MIRIIIHKLNNPPTILFLAASMYNLFPMFLSSLYFTYAYSVNTNAEINRMWRKYMFAVCHSS